MKHLSFIFAVIACLFSVHANAYTVAPSCPDFTGINASYVDAQYGRTSNPFFQTGIITGRHTVITTQGTDPRTGNALNLLPPGESAVVKLGNEQIGAEAEALTYHFIVDSDKPILLVKFAVVLQDPNHFHDEQPRFVMRIMDQYGRLIEDCAEYDVSARADIEGFQAYGGGTTVRWRNWTNVGLDMSAFAGREVQVQFITYDCSLSGHFGYAYFTASCISNKLQLSACTGNTFTVEAPDGFASYLWDNGDITHTTTRNKTGEDMSLSCLITSATGCQFTLSAYVSSTYTPTQDTEIADEICQGEPYTKNYFDLPPQMRTGTYSFYNTFLNPNTCSGNITTKLDLTIRQIYYSIKASICQGENYTENGFTIQNPAVGIRRDTLFLKSKTTSCDSIICLELAVSPSFNIPNTIVGDAAPCTHKPVAYSFPDIGNMTQYTWEVPENVTIMAGQGTNHLLVSFLDVTPGTIVLKGENGCGSGTISLPVKPRPSYEDLISDSICAGNVYNRYGFNLGIQDSAGYFMFAHNEKTTLGCDSITTLELFVYPTPTIRIEMQGDSVLCNTQTITLHAVASNDPVTFAKPPKIAIGDILCTDGTFVKPNQYATSGKVAEGVVFFVDNTGEHGWVVDLTNKTAAWADAAHATYDIPNIPNLSCTGNTNDDINGYSNTGIIRNTGDATAYPMAWAVDFDNGWYLPAAGQLASIIGVIEFINPTLQLLGMDLFTHSNTNAIYWSSTEGSDTKYAIVYNGFGFCYALGIKTNTGTFRSIKNF